MSDIVGDIHAAIKSLAQTTLGTDYLPLRKIIDPSENDARIIVKGFAVKHGEATNTEGVIKAYTLNQKFQLLITNSAFNRDDENTVQDVFNNLYDKADDFLNAAFLTKLGLPSTVLLVDQPEIAEPAILSNGAALLILTFNVKYRRVIA
jgi:hypothetical protein